MTGSDSAKIVMLSPMAKLMKRVSRMYGGGFPTLPS